MIYVFSHVSLARIFETIPYIFNSDSAHEAKGLYHLTFAYFSRIFLYKKNFFITGTFVGMFIWMLLYYILGIKQHKLSYLCYLTGTGIWGIVLLVVYRIFVADEPNCVVFVPNVVAFMTWLYAEKSQRLNELLYCIWLPGMTCTYFEYLASNTGFSAISGFSIIAAFGSIAIIIEITEQYGKDKISRISICFLGVIFVGLLAYYRITYVFWEDGGISSLTSKIEYGVCKGLLVTENEASTYYDILNDTKEMRGLAKNDRVLYIGDKVLWMSGEQRCGCYSPLGYSITSTRDILYDYYLNHPEMIAKEIYIQDGMGDENMIKEMVNHFGYDYRKGKAGGILRTVYE